jgi:hypothetical protein
VPGPKFTISVKPPSACALTATSPSLTSSTVATHALAANASDKLQYELTDTLVMIILPDLIPTPGRRVHQALNSVLIAR